MNYQRILGLTLSLAMALPAVSTPVTVYAQTPVAGQTDRQLPHEDLGNVRTTADNQARMIANRVVNLYGKAENFRYQLYLGVRQGVALYNFASGSIENNGDYRSGQSVGDSEGRDKGYLDGQSAGSSAGRNQGLNEASARFDAVIDQGTMPQLAVSVPAPNFGGLQSSLPAPKSIEARIKEKSDEFNRILNAQSFYDDGYTLSGDYWHSSDTPFYTVYGWQDYRWDLVRGWYRDDWAWEVWKDHRIGGNYSNVVSYYERVTDPNRTSNATEAREAFISSFKRTYNSVIDEKWMNVVQQPNLGAQALGLNLGTSIGRDYARDLGYNSGFGRTYTGASVQGYSVTYPSAYRTGFDESVRVHQSSVVVSDLQARLVDTQGGVDYFVPGLPVTVIIDKVANSGALRGRAQALVQGPLVTSVTPAQVELQALATNKGQPIVLSNIGVVADNVAPNTNVSYNIAVGERVVSAQGRVNFSSLVWALGSSGNRRHLDYIKTHLDKEWKDAKKNPYVNGGGSLLEQVVRTYAQMDAAKKAKFRESLSEIKALYPKPGFLSGAFTHSDDRFKSATELLKQIQ